MSGLSHELKETKAVCSFAFVRDRPPVPLPAGVWKYRTSSRHLALLCKRGAARGLRQATGSCTCQLLQFNHPHTPPRI